MCTISFERLNKLNSYSVDDAQNELKIEASNEKYLIISLIVKDGIKSFEGTWKRMDYFESLFRWMFSNCGICDSVSKKCYDNSMKALLCLPLQPLNTKPIPKENSVLPAAQIKLQTDIENLNTWQQDIQDVKLNHQNRLRIIKLLSERYGNEHKEINGFLDLVSKQENAEENMIELTNKEICNWIKFRRISLQFKLDRGLWG